MKHLILILVLFTSVCFGQNAFDKSEVLFNKYLKTDSLKAKEQLIYQSKHAHSQKEKTNFKLNTAEYYCHNDQPKLAQKTLQSISIDVCKKDVEIEGERTRIQALIYFKANQYEKSNKLLSTFLSSHKNVSNKLKVGLELDISENDIALGKYTEANTHVLVGYNIFRKAPSTLPNKLKSRLLLGLYDTYYYQAKYDSALYYLYKAEPFIESNSIAKSGFYDRIAIVHAVLEHHQQAILYYKRSIAILKKKNAPINLTHAYCNLAITTKELDRDKAIVYFKEALKTSQSIHYNRMTGYVLQELGDLYLTQKEYTLSEKYNKEAVELMRITNNDHGMMSVLLNLGRLAYQTKQYQEALKYLEEAQDMMEKSQDVPLLEYCYEYLYKTYERMGNYKMAHQYHKHYYEIKRKLFKAELQNNVERLNLAYEIRVEKATNKLLKKEVTLKNKKLSAERNVKWLLGILLFSLLIGAWFLRRLLIQRTRLKEYELQLTQSKLKGLEIEKNLTLKELDTVKDQLISKNNLIGELNKLIRNNEQSLVSKDKFGSLITNDTDWVEFLAKVQLVFPHFIDNLNSKHSSLSNNEFRLAALIRLNLSDKEISELLIIELSSVKKAKNRLKQKLGLDGSDKLSMYLSQL